MTKPKAKPEPVARTSADLPADQLARLKEIFPECFAEGRVDFDKLRSTLGEEVDSRPERYSFTWAGKRDAIRLLQTPSRATLIPCPEQSVNFEETGNLFIEGDNLEVLKLLYKPYFGRVKMIYIDPPYNTGEDRIYKDDYSDPLKKYLRLTSQEAPNGDLTTSNPETSGRFHSDWLSTMYPRIFAGRQLLREDGVIWISIDDTEVSNLRLVCNEVLGEENFVACFIWEKRTTRENRRVFSFNHDYILCYAKDKDRFQASRNLLPLSEEALSRYENPDNDPRGDWQSVSLNAQAGHATANQFYSIKTPGGREVSLPPGRCWSVTREKLEEFIRDNRVWFGPGGNNVPRLKVFRSEAKEGLTPHTLWTAEEVGTTDSAKKALIDLFAGVAVYDTPKPVPLINRMLQISTGTEDIVLDFFGGSSTTAQAVLESNREDGGTRQFILVQLPEPTPPGSEAHKAGYKTIADVGKERIRRAIRKIEKEHSKKLDFENRETPEDLGFKVLKLAESNYKPWIGIAEKDSEAYGKTMALYTDPLAPGWKPENVIWEVIIKEGFGLNSSIEKLSEIKGNTVYRVSDPERGQSLHICLDDALKSATIKALSLSKDNLFICRDKALDDEGAANLALQCRLKTI